jgi:hypothetical protein
MPQCCSRRADLSSFTSRRVLFFTPNKLARVDIHAEDLDVEKSLDVVHSGNSSVKRGLWNWGNAIGWCVASRAVPTHPFATVAPEVCVGLLCAYRAKEPTAFLTVDNALKFL